MKGNSIKRMMSYTVSTKRRPPVASDGKQLAPTPYLASLRTTPIDPLVTDEFHNIIIRFKIESPERMYMCYAESTADVQIGDVICYGNREYTLKGLGIWPYDEENFYEMILEEHVNV